MATNKTRPVIHLFLLVIAVLVISTSVNANQAKTSRLLTIADNMNGTATITYTHSDSEYIKVLVTTPSEALYQYVMNCSVLTVPFTEGKGVYKVQIVRNLRSDTYELLREVQVSNTYDDVDIYTNSYANVTFSLTSDAVKQASELVSSSSSEEETIAIIRDYMAKNFTYDKEKSTAVKTIQTDYTVDSNKIMQDRQGICYDFATVFAIMLRSQNIPCKVVTGYVNGLYHAWNEVYVEDTWKVVDITYDIIAFAKRQPLSFLQVYKKSSKYTHILYIF